MVFLGGVDLLGVVRSKMELSTEAVDVFDRSLEYSDAREVWYSPSGVLGLPTSESTILRSFVGVRRLRSDAPESELRVSDKEPSFLMTSSGDFSLLSLAKKAETSFWVRKPKKTFIISSTSSFNQAPVVGLNGK